MLESLWFFLWILLWAVYFMLDGFDFGIGILMPFLSKNETEKRIMYQTAGPFWDGNEVWLIAAGGVTFAAFPKAYGVMFSALYAPLFMLLFALILRAVTFEFRDKVESSLWRKLWDNVHFAANLLSAILLGVAFANLFMGIPIDANGVYKGNLLMLLNPYGLTGALFFLLFFIMHGALWLIVKTEGELQLRALMLANFLWPCIVLILIFFVWMTNKYTNILSTYLENPALFIFPTLAIVGILGTRICLTAGKIILAWGCHALFIAGITFSGVSGTYPAIVLSSIDSAASATVMNSASSPLTLKIMLGVVIIMIPIVIAYQVWMYKLFAHKVTAKDLDVH
ncbi:MAG: cytochrome d ubiquinol oxidase subunit II [Desulfovibrio sp.]|nr:cytochrome d ubiquinol oxidase subunit II [Desulfovibrio sp.]